MQSCNKTKSNGCGTGQGLEQGKDTTTVYCFMYAVTYTILLAGDTVPQLSHKESKEKTTLRDKGLVILHPRDWTSWVFMAWNLADRKSLTRPCRLPAPSRCLDGATRDVSSPWQLA